MHNSRYLKYAIEKVNLFTNNADYRNVDAYTDSDQVGTMDDLGSTSIQFTFVGGNFMTWRSKKQNIISRSRVEAEFKSMTLGIYDTKTL